MRRTSNDAPFARFARFARYAQFAKFGAVGVLNTAISYGVYWLLVRLGVPYIAASVAGFFASVLNAYFWNDAFVFRKETGESRPFWRTLAKTVAAYGFTGLILQNALLLALVEAGGVSRYVAPILTLAVTVPLNFLVNKHWSFRV